MSEIVVKKPIQWVKLALMMVPLWLGVSVLGGVGILLWMDKKAEAKERTRFVQMVSAESLLDDVRKLTEVIGERNSDSEFAQANLKRTANMIENLLGPMNTGYKVNSLPSLCPFPLLDVCIRSQSQSLPPLVVITSYGSPKQQIGMEQNATGVAAVLAAAQAMAQDKVQRDVHFIFIPSDKDATVNADLRKELTKFPKAPQAVFLVEAMGAYDTLYFSSPKPFSSIQKVHEFGKVFPYETHPCLAELQQNGFERIARVSSRAPLMANEDMVRMPEAMVLARATGRLIEWLRREAAVSK